MKEKYTKWEERWIKKIETCKDRQTLRQIINKIYDDGYVDGNMDTESETCEPNVDWHDLD